MTRAERFMPNGIPKHVRIYDNGGETYDRYTAVYTGKYKGRNGCEYVGMSGQPFHPQGFGIHGWNETAIDYPSYKHLGRKIKFKDLPEDCQTLVIRDYRENWRITP
jgi:hypothetical protein